MVEGKTSSGRQVGSMPAGGQGGQGSTVVPQEVGEACSLQGVGWQREADDPLSASEDS